MKKIEDFSPIHQQYAYLLYCKYVFNYDDTFEKDVMKVQIIQKIILLILNLKIFSKSKINKKLNYTIFLNGEKQYFENIKIINFLKQFRKNLNFFC